MAACQGGAVSTAQLEAAGLGRGAVARRVREGRLHRMHQGVYAVGHAALAAHGRLWAAVLAGGGPGTAALSHRAAAWRWGMVTVPAGAIDVSTLLHRRPVAGLRIHRPRTLRPADIRREDDGLPLTSPARTLVDLAAVLDVHRLERACHRAEHQRLLDVHAVAEILARGRFPGARALRSALSTLRTTDPEITRSDIEERFLALVTRAGLPRPRVNHVVLGEEVDFFWPELRLIVETDGAATHVTATAFQDDRRRDAKLTVGGYRVLRFTWRDVVGDPGRVQAVLHSIAYASIADVAAKPARS